MYRSYGQLYLSDVYACKESRAVNQPAGLNSGVGIYVPPGSVGYFFFLLLADFHIDESHETTPDLMSICAYIYE